ncbi:MAG: glycosyltransferase, partial [Bacteroidia bacterium]
MKTKKNILIFTDWYLPAYKAGGPVKSIASLAFYLKDTFNIYIITGNKDVYATEPHSNVKSNTWQVLPNGEQVYYFSDEVFSFKDLSILLKETPYDVVYLNSFFSKRFTIYPLLQKKLNNIKTPVLLAPRGMLGSGSLNLKSKKKNVFIQLAKTIGLYKNVIWHATSLQEENEIKTIFGNKVPIKIMSNLILPPVQNRAEYNKEVNDVKICCIARVSKIKNILFAIEVLQTIQAGSITFDLYGPIEEADYHKKCLQLIAQLPKNISVAFKGDLQGEEVEQTLKNYHLFFLPTLNENFG